MTPVRSARSETLIRVVTVISLVVSVIYITWRWGWTLNTDALWFSVPLAVAETYGLLTAFFLAFSAWSLNDRRPRPPLRGRTVDVFVTTYDEPLAIIRKTALSAREIRYPHTTYILDDGRREEVRRLAAEIGVTYVTRDDNRHAKAGNLNNALASSTGEFILQLDADHVPLPQMIERLIGFFADDEVALAQSPQDFYNTDAFTYEVDVQGRRIWEDQQLFFRVLQPGKDRVNAAFFVGSCAMIRRAALEEIGGFATGTITEDIETSLLLHGRGWKSVYLNETLAYGLAPSTALAFHVQHLRWGQGAMQTLKRYKPLRMSGLTLAQRLGYLDSLTTYLGGFQRLILYLAPLVFFTTGVFPLEASATAFLLLFVPYLALQLLSFKLLTRGHGSVLLADRFAMAKFFTHVMAITGYTTRRRLGFRVTPKEAGKVPAGVYAPQAILIAVTFAAIGFAVYERTLGVAPEEVPGWGAVALWVNIAYALWNAVVAAYIVRVSLGGQHRRVEHRFAEAMAVTLRIIRADGKLSAYDIAITDNLNPHGAALRCMNRIEAGSRVEMVLPLHWRDVSVRGRMVHHAEHPTPYGTVHVHGVEFDGLDAETRDAIELHCAQHATPMERQRYQEGAASATGTYRLRNLRQQPRLAVGMPVRITVGNEGATRSLGVGLLEDVSPLGARMLLDHPVAPGSMLRLEVPGSELAIEGRVVFVHALETSVGVRFVAGLETPAEAVDAETDPDWLDSILASTGRYRIAAVARASAASETVRRTVISALASTRRDPAAHAAAPTTELPVAGMPTSDGVATIPHSTLAEVVAAAELLADDATSALPVERYDIVEAVAASAIDLGQDVPSSDVDQAGIPADARESAWNAWHDASDAAPPAARELEAEVLTFAPITATVDAQELDAPPMYFDSVSVTVDAPELHEAPMQFDAVTATVTAPEWYAEAALPMAPITATVEAPDFSVAEWSNAPITATVEAGEIAVTPLSIAPISALVEAREISVTPLSIAPISVAVATPDFSVPPMHFAPISVTVDAPELFVSPESPSMFVPASTSEGETPMQTADFSSPTRSGSQAPAILAVRGGSARLEGKFDIEESIEVQCDLSGELNVGGTMIIGERGTVSANVKTVNAVILGTYNGNLVASGSIEIAASGRVSGTLESNELVIAKGGIFTGSVARSAAPTATATVAATPSTSAAAASAEPAAPAASEPAQPSPRLVSSSELDADESELSDITAIGSPSDLDGMSDVAVPVIPTLADRDADDGKSRNKPSPRLQSVTLS